MAPSPPTLLSCHSLSLLCSSSSWLSIHPPFLTPSSFPPFFLLRPSLLYPPFLTAFLYLSSRHTPLPPSFFLTHLPPCLSPLSAPFPYLSLLPSPYPFLLFSFPFYTQLLFFWLSFACFLFILPNSLFSFLYTPLNLLSSAFFICPSCSLFYSFFSLIPCISMCTFCHCIPPGFILSYSPLPCLCLITFSALPFTNPFRYSITLLFMISLTLPTLLFTYYLLFFMLYTSFFVFFSLTIPVFCFSCY